ncbi:MAG: hypothetical protein ACF8NJ_10265 [Phycisphaerales bacterium JB038]
MNSSLQSFWIRLTADKKKFGALCLCCGVALLFWGRLVFLREVPRSAYAEPGAAQTSQTAKAAQSSRHASAGADATPLRILVREVLHRDPFALDPAHFPEPIQEEPVAEVTPKSPEPMADLEAETQADHRLDLAREAKRRLNLVSVVAGKEPMAMIRAELPGGQKTLLVGVGHQIAGYRVVEIDVTGRAVTVRKEDVSVTLSMKQETDS